MWGGWGRWGSALWRPRDATMEFQTWGIVGWTLLSLSETLWLTCTERN